MRIVLPVAMLLVFFPLHECLHAFGFLVFGKAGLNNVRFGSNLNAGILYCTCDLPLKKHAYFGAVLLPFLVTAVCGVAVVLWGNVVWAAVWAILTSGAAGDLCMADCVRRQDKNAYFLDHPKYPAFYLMYPENETPQGFRCVTALEEETLQKAFERSKKFRKK